MLGDRMFGDRTMLGDWWRLAEAGLSCLLLLLWRAIPVFGEAEL